MPSPNSPLKTSGESFAKSKVRTLGYAARGQVLTTSKGYRWSATRQVFHPKAKVKRGSILQRFPLDGAPMHLETLATIDLAIVPKPGYTMRSVEELFTSVSVVCCSLSLRILLMVCAESSVSRSAHSRRPRRRRPWPGNRRPWQRTRRNPQDRVQGILRVL